MKEFKYDFDLSQEDKSLIFKMIDKNNRTDGYCVGFVCEEVLSQNVIKLLNSAVNQLLHSVAR